MWHMGTWDDPLVTRGGDTRSGRSSVPFSPAPPRVDDHRTKPGRRGGEHFRSPGHVEPVTCLFSLIARCGRGAFQLSVLVSHACGSLRGAPAPTPRWRSGAGAILHTNAGGIKREGLSRKRVPSLGPLRCTRFNSSRPETHSRASTANPSMTIMKHNIQMTTTAFP
jgi:hypothetical protein